MSHPKDFSAEPSSNHFNPAQTALKSSLNPKLVGAIRLFPDRSLANCYFQRSLKLKTVKLKIIELKSVDYRFPRWEENSLLYHLFAHVPSTNNAR